MELNRLFNGVDGSFDRLHGPSEHILVSEAGGVVVGFACLQVCRSACHPDPRSELTELFVDPQHRRAGAGRALVEAADRLASELGCRQLLLHTRENNLAARALYASSGFETAPHVVYRKPPGPAAAVPPDDGPASE